MSRIDYDAQPAPSPGFSPALAWRKVVDAMWALEHAFERARAADRAVDDTRLRIFAVLALFSCAFVAVGVAAGQRALFSHAAPSDYAPPLPAAARADLVDRNGQLLALDLTHYGLYLDPHEIWDKAEVRRGLAAALPELSKARLDGALKGDRRAYLIGGLTPQERERVRDLGLPGVGFEEEARRVYPLGATAAHLIGFSDSGGHGIAGAEKALDPAIVEAARGGGTVPLSIDLRVQAALEDELRKGVAEFSPKGAVGIVTDIRTGEILAMASLPDFDPNAPGKADPNGMLNRAASSVFEMGSTFKTYTFAMALDSGVETMASTFDASQPLMIGSRAIHDYHKGESILSMQEAFIMSSNISTAKIALHAGAARLTDYFRRYGLFAPAKVELTEAARPLVPKKWDDSTVASASFGQAIGVSPLNMAAGVGSLMNGGVWHPLTILKRAPNAPLESRRVIKPETSRLMLGLMRDNVVMPEGSGKKADALGLRVGGKTGSAQKAGRHGYDNTKNVSSFAAVFPTDGPVDGQRYLVLVLYDEPHATPKTFGFMTAGWNAAPTAGRVIDRIAPFLGVQRVAATPFDPPKNPAVAKPVDDETSTGPL